MTEIRKYTKSDYKRLVEIFKQNVPLYFAPHEIKDLIEYLESNSDTYLTIIKNNEVVGGTGYIIDTKKKQGKITWMFFEPNHKSNGLGKEVVTYCLDLLDKEVKKTIVTTSQFEYRFFMKLNFRLIRTVRNYWGKGLDLFEMIREI